MVGVDYFGEHKDLLQVIECFRNGRRASSLVFDVKNRIRGVVSGLEELSYRVNLISCRRVHVDSIQHPW